AKGAPQFGSNYLGGPILYARLQWSGTNATFDTNWIALTNTSYRDYYDLDITNVSAPEGTSLGGDHLNLWPMGSRLAMTVIRDGFLWSCHVVGLNGTNGTFTNTVYADDQSSTNVDRSGVQWTKLRVDAAGGTLSYSSHGRAYDRV